MAVLQRFLTYAPTLGNGEVDSSILSGSTSFPFENQRLSERALPVPPRLAHEQKPNSPQTVGENAGTLFLRCSQRGLRNPPPLVPRGLPDSDPTSSRSPRRRANACPARADLLSLRGESVLAALE